MGEFQKRRLGCFIASLVAWVAFFASNLQGQYYFWGSWHDPDPSIRTADVAGQNISTVYSDVTSDVFELSYNENDSRLYGVNAFDDQVFRVDTDGSNYTPLVSQNRPVGIDLDLSSGKMYWTSVSDGAVRRANFDGSNVETLVTGLSTPYGLDLDLINNKIYWIELGVRVARSDLDGSNVEGIITSGLGSSDWGVAVNEADNKLYWAQSNTIRRSNLDGSSQETFVASPVVGTLYVLEYSSELNRLYWSDYGPTSRLSGINADGSGQKVFVLDAGTTSMSGIAIIPEPSTYALCIGIFILLITCMRRFL